MNQTVTIVGVKKFKGDVEGNHFDNTKLRVLMSVPDNAPNETGFNVTEMAYGDSKNYDSIARMTFPFQAVLHFEMQLKSGRMVPAISKVEPVNKLQEKG